MTIVKFVPLVTKVEQETVTRNNTCKKPVLIGKLFQLHEDSHDRKGGRHLIIIISLFMTS